MTLYEIIESVKNNAGVSNDDLRYALLALEALHSLDRMDTERIADRIDDDIATHYIHESWRRSHTALNAIPREWLGPSNLPESEEYQRRRKMALGILKKVEDDRSSKP